MFDLSSSLGACPACAHLNHLRKPLLVGGFRRDQNRLFNQVWQNFSCKIQSAVIIPTSVDCNRLAISLLVLSQVNFALYLAL